MKTDSSSRSERPRPESIAVVGSGIAGLMSAWLLGRDGRRVVLFEREKRLGGHTHTRELELGGHRVAVDSGFIVFNDENYPLFSRLLRELGVGSKPTTMSFSVRNRATGLEYAATNLDALFCQRRNLVSPEFLGMLVDLARFYRHARSIRGLRGQGPTLGEYLRDRRFSKMFADSHLVPMASALWSAPASSVLELPMRFLVEFMDHHRMLDFASRPRWRVVEGGSSSYIEALEKAWSVEVRLATPVRRVRRAGTKVLVTTDPAEEAFDHVVMACHSDQTLALLDSPTSLERELLAAIPYQTNDVVLHTDRSFLPRHRSAWAAWNAVVPETPDAPCAVSYCMNLLQGFESEEPVLVTLNAGDSVDPSRVLERVRYAHPVFRHEGLVAQSRVDEIDGVDGISFAGAYWGYGFHEDGVRSAVRVAKKLGIAWN